MDDRSPPPFLSSSKSDVAEVNEWPARQDPEPVFRPSLNLQEKESPLDKLKGNPLVMGMLIGIVIGIVLTNMRPVIINPPK
jgi:hypothetical protein